MVPTMKENDYLKLLKVSANNHKVFNIQKEDEGEPPCESQ